MTSIPSNVYHISTRYLVTLRHRDPTETSNNASGVSPGIARRSVTCIHRVGCSLFRILTWKHDYFVGNIDFNSETPTLT